MVAFEYRDEAIRSAGDGKWYPLVLMDWVEGATLFEYVRARCLTGRVESVANAAQALGGASRNLPAPRSPTATCNMPTSW